MGTFATNDPLGSFSLVPTPFKSITQGSYLNFADGSGNDFAQQYLPEIYEAEVERYGNRTISGFLRMVGAEMPMTSDQVIWSEQNRLHLSFESGMGGSGVPANASNITIGGSTTLIQDVAGEDSAGASIQPIIRAGSTIVVYNTVSLNSVKCFVAAEPVRTLQEITGSLMPILTLLLTWMTFVTMLTVERLKSSCMVLNLVRVLTL
jgi:hypothetical protein